MILHILFLIKMHLNLYLQISKLQTWSQITVYLSEHTLINIHKQIHEY